MRLRMLFSLAAALCVRYRTVLDSRFRLTCVPVVSMSIFALWGKGA